MKLKWINRVSNDEALNWIKKNKTLVDTIIRRIGMYWILLEEKATERWTWYFPTTGNRAVRSVSQIWRLLLQYDREIDQQNINVLMYSNNWKRSSFDFPLSKSDLIVWLFKMYRQLLPNSKPPTKNIQKTISSTKINIWRQNLIVVTITVIVNHKLSCSSYLNYGTEKQKRASPGSSNAWTI